MCRGTMHFLKIMLRIIKKKYLHACSFHPGTEENCCSRCNRSKVLQNFSLKIQKIYFPKFFLSKNTQKLELKNKNKACDGMYEEIVPKIHVFYLFVLKFKNGWIPRRHTPIFQPACSRKERDIYIYVNVF